MVQARATISDWADLTGFEPATSGLTGRRALQAAPQVQMLLGLLYDPYILYPQRDLNPCYRRERATS